MSESACLGAIGSLCISVMYPYYWTRQWGINGFPCLRHFKCDCGWAGENDHEFFGTAEEQARAAEEERRHRMALANRLVDEREQQRIRGFVARHPLDKLHIAAPGNILAHGRHGHFFGRTGVPNPNVPGGGGEEENLDDLVGGEKVRKPQRAMVGGEDEDISGTVGRTKASRSSLGLSKSSFSTHEKQRIHPKARIVATDGIEGTEDTALGRGVMAPQTVLLSPPRQGQGQGQGRGRMQQQPYMGTAPMRLSNDQETDEDTVVAGKSSTEGDHSPTSKRGFGSKFSFGKKDPENDKDSN